MNLIYGIYFFVPTMIGLFKKEKQQERSDKQCKIAILIPARNEETVIGNLVESLMQQNYPKDKFNIYVLINHTTDQTLEIAMEKGASIVSCPDSVRGKADVLRIGFHTLKKEEIDAYMIFDADNVIDSNFLAEMNQTRQNGFLVAQGFRDSKNKNDNWISGGYSIFYFVQNLFYHAKKKNNISSMVNGTGFMIDKKIIDTYGFSMETLTEDMEFSAFCSLHNIPIGFNRNAITYDEQPTQFKTSWRQRQRWTKGAYQCLKKYGKKLLNVKENHFINYEVFLILFSPLLQVITCTVMGMNLLYVGIRDGFFNLLASSIILGIMGYLGLICFAFFTVKYNGKKFGQINKGIFGFPILLLTWIPIQFVGLFKKVKKWEPIPHTVDIKIEQL